MSATYMQQRLFFVGSSPTHVMFEELQDFTRWSPYRMPFAERLKAYDRWETFEAGYEVGDEIISGVHPPALRVNHE